MRYNGIMQRRSLFSRWLTVWLMFSMLVVGILGGAGLSVRAAPEKAGIPGYVVISEFRTLGPNGSNDEFIEIFNRSNNPVPITNWKIRKSSGCGTTLTDLVTIGTFTLAAGQYFLIGNSSGYAGTVDLSYTSSVSDDGGIAIVDDLGSIIDQVGMCSTTTYKEFDITNPLYLSPQSGSSDQSYWRNNNGCTDTDDNYADFVSHSPSDPQNTTSTPIKCLKVTNVTATTANGTYISGQTITITVEFSSNVNVTGSPALLLETGITDRLAAYTSGSGSNTLAFDYKVQSGDVSDDLDYVTTNSLTLNGGTITGAVGDADLTLPSPGSPGSLGANKAIVIDNQTAPSVISFKRQDPLTSPTNSDVLIFRVMFSEPVIGVSANDFVVTGTTATVTGVTTISSSLYDVEISGGNLSSLNGDVGLNLSGAQNITDATGNPLPSVEPGIDEKYTLDNMAPTVTIEQATGQPDPANGTPVIFSVVFSEPIDTSTLTTADFTQNGSILTSITWNIIDSGDHKTFTLSATSISGNGTLSPSMSAGKVLDLAGNPNTASISTDNTVTFIDNIPPSVTINQASGQSDPANTLPINFTIVFSEPIIPNIFTPSDITQSGTATGITWSLTDSGDHKKFTLSATAVNGYGTLIPSIAANRVTDPVGNNNSASTSTDNRVEYKAIQPLTIVINEVAWAGTQSSADDEWIELYNPGTVDINLTNWSLLSSDGSPNIKSEFNGIILKAGDYLLLERNDEDTVADITADLIYTGSLSNSGEILRLYGPGNTLVDTANINGYYWPAGNTYTYSSMERSFISADSDYVWVTYNPATDSLAVASRATDASGNIIKGTPKRKNSQINVAPTPTPKFSYSGGSSGSGSGSSGAIQYPPVLAISEFLPRPGHDWNNDGYVDVFDEFIEIINAGLGDVNLGGYSLDDEANSGSRIYTLPAIVLKPGEHAVFYASETGILLSDAGDSVRLLRGGSIVVDAYTYGVVRYPDQSWCRIPDKLGYWSFPCFPTPGNPNALTGKFPLPSGPGSGYYAPVCLLSDTTPDVFVYAECESSGDEIWNRQYWDLLDGTERIEIDTPQKWGTIFE